MVKLLKNCLISLLMLLGVMPISAMLQPSGTTYQPGVYPAQPVNKNTGVSGKSTQNLHTKEAELRRQLAMVEREKAFQAAQDEEEESSFNTEGMYDFYKVARGVTIGIISAFRIHHYASRLLDVTENSLNSKFSLGCFAAGGVIALLDYCIPKVGTFVTGALFMDGLNLYLNTRPTEIVQKAAEKATEALAPVVQKTAEIALKTGTAVATKIA